MGTIQVGLDQVDSEQECERRATRLACTCCGGTGYLRAVSIKDPPHRACEYCGGRGTVMALPYDERWEWN